MKTKFILVTLVLVSSVILAACAGINPTPVALNGTDWILATLNGQSVLSDTTVTLGFEGGMVSGSDGCNRYSTSFTTSGSNLTFGKDIASTKMACPKEITQQASSYIAVLSQTATFKSDGKQFTLIDASGKNLAEFTVQSTSLAGTSWVVTGYDNGKQVVVTPIADSNLTAKFSADGKLGGSGGCNSYNANYETTGKSIKISGSVVTLMMCGSPAGVMEQEAQYLKALEAATNFRVEGNQMDLLNTDGSLVATFKKAN